MEGKTNPPQVLILGAGFGGLFAARALRDEHLVVTLIDCNNYHTFMPLFYRVPLAPWIYTRILLRGYLAWLVWIDLHLIVLIGFCNQLNVLVD